VLETPREVAKEREPEQRSNHLESIGDLSCGPERDLARAVRLAAEAGEWDVVAMLSRQLESLFSPR
jgi:hypothetical protein